MAIITNFDRLKDLYEEAKRKGVGSKAWIDFASTMLDSFPDLYGVAQKMNKQSRCSLGPPRPIKEAPRHADLRLLLRGEDGVWSFGGWDVLGQCWIDDQGAPLAPTHWLPNPDILGEGDC